LYRRVASAGLALVTIGAVAAVMAPSNASAESAALTKFAANASATHFKGEAFDVCTAPSVSQMTKWSASPYRAFAVYVGGPNRGCAQPNLTSAWVKTVSAKGWKLMPIYVGLQAPCATRTTFKSIVAAQAAAQGEASATDAITALKGLGLRPGSAVYTDMESYRTNDAACSTAVLTYISTFTKELHRRGYLAGVYGKSASTIADLSKAHGSTTYARPDAIWLAEWDGVKSLAGFAGVPAASWSAHQRAKQYLGDHYETHGGVKLRIDSNLLDTPVATVARSYRSTGRTNLRTAPARSATAGGVIEKNIALNVMCQAPGTTVSGTKVWNKLTNGKYISDHFVNTPSSTSYSTTLPRCQYPYQVAPATGTTSRAGAGNEFQQNGSLPSGALAWTVCQTPTTVATGTSKVWDRLSNGHYVPDYHLASASQTTYSVTVPRC
jgi:glycoside hydrolase-like protein